MQRYLQFILFLVALAAGLLAGRVEAIDAESAGIDPAADQRPYRVESAGEGRSVWLVPGLSSPGWVWNDLAERLRAAGYRTHIVTLAGFAGQPPMRPLPSGEAPFLSRVRDALAADLAVDAGLAPVVIGHSLGGFMAFWLAATESDRLAAAVAVDGVPFISGLAGEAVTVESQRPGAEQLAAFMASLTPEQFAQQNRMSLQVMISDPAMTERVAEDSGRSDPATVGRAIAEMMTTDLRPQMADVQVPVLLVQAADSGANDAYRRAYAAQVAAIPDHRHVVAEQGRHFVQLDDPEFLAREVFALLERVEAGAGHD